MADIVFELALKLIGEFVNKEALFLNDVKEDTKWVQDQLREINRFLKDSDSQLKSDQSLKYYVRNWREIAYKAEDIIEAFFLKMERNQDRSTRTARAFHIKHKFGKQIRSLKADIDNFQMNKENFGNTNLHVDNTDASIVELRQKHINAPSFNLVGMDYNKKEVKKILLCKDVKNRSVLSIVGMGGLGKSTLARIVYNDDDVASHFDLMAWVSVTQRYEGAEILKNLIAQISGIGSYESDKMTIQELQKNLEMSLLGKKYLIIMDDVWEENVWDIVEDCLPDERNGSRVLITTRTHRVASRADSSTMPYRLQFLNNDESWELFSRKAFSNPNGRSSCDDSFEELGKKMVEKCGGLPLALREVGKLVYGRREAVEEWTKIERNLFSKHKVEMMCMRVLALSYANLPHHLKWCFLYMGVFPKGTKIDAHKLIRLWIAENLISHEGSESLETIAEGYLEELVQRCLVQVTDSFPRNGDTCCIHNLLHEFIVQEASDVRLVRCYGNVWNPHPIEYERLRRLSLHTNPEDFFSNRCPTPVLRTLLGFSFGSTSIDLSLSKMKMIRVIDLEGAQIHEIPDEIGDMRNLQYLGLRNTSVSCLPKSIEKLPRLQTLDIRETKVDRLCQGLWKIVTLRHVLIPLGIELEGIDKGDWSNIQVLEEAKAGDWMSTGLPKLSNLQSLRLTSVDSSQHTTLSTALPCFSRLVTLELGGKSIPNIVLMLSRLTELRTLILHGPIESSPRGLNYQWALNLTELKLSDTWLDEDPLPALGNLCDLRVLELKMNAYCGKEMTCPHNTFPRLRSMTFFYLQMLEKWTLGDGALPRLENLAMSGSQNLKRLPRGLKNLAKLKELTLENMSEALNARVSKNGEDHDIVRHIPSFSIIRGRGMQP